MRCFVAFDLPQPVRNHLGNVTAPLRERYDIRWVPPEQMHLTILFAGDIDGDGLDAIASAVDRFEPQPLTLSLQQLGVFPPKGMPRVVWAGLGGDVDAVRAAKDTFEAVSYTHLTLPTKRIV